MGRGLQVASQGVVLTNDSTREDIYIDYNV